MPLDSALLCWSGWPQWIGLKADDRWPRGQAEMVVVAAETPSSPRAGVMEAAVGAAASVAVGLRSSLASTRLET
jgi:hypothetical protein